MSQCDNRIVNGKEVSELLISFEKPSCLKKLQNSKNTSCYPLVVVDNQYKQLCLIGDIEDDKSNDFYSFSIAGHIKKRLNYLLLMKNQKEMI